MGSEFQLGKLRNSGDVYTTMCICLIPLNYKLKTVTMGNFILFIFYQSKKGGNLSMS
jgi:hypothetical protein